MRVGRKLVLAGKIAVTAAAASVLVLGFWGIYPVFLLMRMSIAGLLYPAAILICGEWVRALLLRHMEKNFAGKCVRWAIRLAQSAGILICAGIVLLEWVFAPYYNIYQCPDDSRKLVVFDGGIGFSPVYMAYPIRMGLFYQKQDNGAVVIHDGAGWVHVTWEEDTAVVFVDGRYGGEFSNPNGEIVVRW